MNPHVLVRADAMSITKTEHIRSGKRTAKRRATAQRTSASSKAKSDGLPGWKEVTRAARKENVRRTSAKKASGTRLDAVSTPKFALLVVCLAIGVALYVNHVYQTQAVLADLQQEQRERQRLHLKYNRLKGELDRLTSPSVVYQRATELGLEPDAAYGPTVVVAEPAP